MQLDGANFNDHMGQTCRFILNDESYLGYAIGIGQWHTKIMHLTRGKSKTKHDMRAVNWLQGLILDDDEYFLQTIRWHHGAVDKGMNAQLKRMS